jgi:hypothetical protein
MPMSALGHPFEDTQQHVKAVAHFVHARLAKLGDYEPTDSTYLIL